MSLNTNNKTTERLYFLDSMRGILILLIVLLHVLQTYNPKQTWVIYTEKGIDFIPYIIDAIMLFVLPSFFIMSGYLAVMSISKMGVDKFFESKIKRILIPIFMIAITFNSLQAYLLVKNGWMEFNLWDYLSTGQWISHLWFLIDLAIFLFLLYLVVKFFKVNVNKLLSVIYNITDKTNVYFLLFLISILTVVLLAVYSALSPYIHNPIIGFRSLAFYLPFFILGGVLYKNKNIFNTFLNLNPYIVIILFFTALVFSQYLLDFEGLFYRLLYYFFDTLTYIYASTLCFYLFYRYVNVQTKFFKLLSNASYSIYLMHHMIVIGLGLIIIKFNIFGITSLVILFFLVIFLSFFIDYFIIQKVPILTFLLNGKPIKKIMKKEDN